MKLEPNMDREAGLRELDIDELAAVAGGNDDDFCGTGRKPVLPPPPRPHW